MGLHSAEVMEDFDSYSDEDPWTGSSQWIVETPEALALGEDYRRGESGKGILIGAGGAPEATSPIYKMGLKLADEKITARCHINIREDGGRFDFYARGNTENGGTETISHIILSGGHLYYGVFGGGLVAIGNYQAETWISLLVEIDLKKQSYDIYVDDVLQQSNVAFSSPQDGKLLDVDMIVIAKNQEGPGQAWVDDIAVISGSKNDLVGLFPDGEPSAEPWTPDLNVGRWSRPQSEGSANESEKKVEKNALGAIIQSDVDSRRNRKENVRAANIGKGIVFSVSGEVPQESRGQWTWKADQASVGSHRYYTIRYKAKGVGRSMSATDILSARGFTASGKRTTVGLLNNGNIICDGRIHVLQGYLKEPFTPASLHVDLLTKNSHAVLEVESLAFTQSPLESLDTQKSSFAGADFSAVSLDSLFNDSLASLYQRLLTKHGAVQDGVSSFHSPSVTLNGIPFQLGPPDRDLILPVEDRSANQVTVPFLGVQVPRYFFGPFGREDVITVPVAAQASEVFFLLANEFVPTRKRYGAAIIPFQFDDIDATFSVELRYEDGEVERAFPYSLSDGEFVLRRMIGAYAVAADPRRKLIELRLINRAYGNTTGLMAVTLNTAEKRVVPLLVEEPALTKVPPITPPAEQPVTLRRTAKGIEGGNSFYQFAIDLSDGFRWSDFVNLWSPGAKVTLAKESGLLLTWNGEDFDGTKFRVTQVQVDGTAAKIELTPKDRRLPLAVTINLTVGTDSHLRTNVSVKNVGAAEESFEVKFPWLKDVVIGTASDTWLFFPKYGNVNTNKDGYFEGANDLMFPMQFFDIYNPQLGGGLSLMTSNIDEVPVRYVAGKSEKGVLASIKYPGQLCRVAPSQTRTYPETSLISHGGDWHEAFSNYRKWLATWNKPFRSQDKQWFIDAFWVHTQITSKDLAEGILMTPALYNAAESKYYVDEVLQADEDVYGSLPDVVNFFAWGYSDTLKDYLYSGSPEEAYGGVGGLALFKDAIQQFQDKHNIPVSLYLYPGPCGKMTAFGQAHGERVALQREDGSRMHDAKDWYACPGSKEWRDYFVGMTKQIQSDTQAKVIYLDVFGFTDAFSCYDPSHGHEIPFVGGQGSTPLLKALREALPEDVVVWHEYPVNDVSTQYSDGNLAYYYLPVRDLICPVYNVEEEAGALLKVTQDVYRYAFPHLKQFGFPCGIEEDTWGHLKFPFFNGEGTFDTTWRLYPSHARDMLAKSLDLKRQYADCFNSLQPEPLVPTERAGVFANQFPGNGRTLWTLYNERMTTVRGDVLSIPHVEGSTYHDVWNGQPLQPRIENGRAIISLKMDPQALGAVCQTLPETT